MFDWRTMLTKLLNWAGWLSRNKRLAVNYVSAAVAGAIGGVALFLWLLR